MIMCLWIDQMIDQGDIFNNNPSDAIEPKNPNPPWMPTERPFVVG